MTFAFKFGTAGIRAVAGPGDDQLNVHTVAAIGHAICAHLATLAPDALTRGLCIGFDGRRDSRVFAEVLTRTAVAHGYFVRVFEPEVPTPVLAFATRSTRAIGGIMVTASHNPAQDNGIKLYLAEGRQVAAPHDLAIAARIVRGGDESPSALAEGRVVQLSADDLAGYFAAIATLVPATATLPAPRLAYSAMCGVGTATTRALFARLAITDVVEVVEQATPQADFGGLRSPNPEEPEALAKLRALAERAQVQLAFAHDPDADRLAVMLRTRTGTVRALSGDEVGALLGGFLLDEHPAPERALLVSTHVSGGLLESVAEARGAHFLRTATGFKWISHEGRARAARDGLELLFGYEEALGYAFFSIADDKDGIAALYVLCELARRLHAAGQSLEDKLDAMAREHGLFVSRQLSVTAEGDAGVLQIAHTMQRLRAFSAASLLGPGSTCRDFEAGPTPLPLLLFSAPDGTRVCVRPSGTEPKLKLYLHARELVGTDGNVEAARRAAEARLATLATRLRALALDATAS